MTRTPASTSRSLSATPAAPSRSAAGLTPQADSATRCPLHQLEPCALVQGADVVVTALGLGREDGRDVLHGLRTRYPSTPLVVEATVSESLELADELAGCTVVPNQSMPGPASVATAVTNVLG